MELKKGISFLGVFSLASGAMISSGIFVLPGLAFSLTGSAVFITYFFAGVLALLGALSIIELSTAMPKAGGDFYFVNRTFGPFLGTISGFLGWFALSLKSAFAIFGITEIVSIFLGINPLLSGAILCIFFVMLNIVGVKEAAIFQNLLIAALISLMLVYIISGMSHIEPKNYSDIFDVGYNKIFITAGFVFISFGGLLKVINVAEEVKNPKKNIPLGIISSIVVITILYTLTTYVITGTLAPEVFRESLTPVADSARNIMGSPGFIIISIASTLAFITTANAGIMAASRYPMALSRDELLPKKISVVNKRFQTPTLAILITGVIIYLSLLLPLEALVKAASTVVLTSYILTNIAVIVFRESHISNYRPSFKVPLYPWLQLITIVIFIIIIVDIGTQAIEISLALLFISFGAYFIYGRKAKDKEYALLHLMKRITDKKLTENLLEDELREVIINRDNINQDNFDALIKKAFIYDFEEHMTFEKLIDTISEKLVSELGMSKEEIISRFKQRQYDVNTAISDFFAIPHIVIEGKNKMLLTIVRNKAGIKFTEDEDNVKAVFLLCGTKEKRVLHLKTLASIATLVGHGSFQEDWIKAKNKIELKDLMLLNKRKRYH